MTTSHPAPPDQLDDHLELDPGDWPARQVYFVMTGLVIPRPIAWVTTLAADGVRNAAPHSYFNVVAHDPPHVMFSSSGVKDTLRNVRATGEFVVNLVSMDVVEQMNFTATDFPSDEDELTWAGLTAAPSQSVAPPRIAEARAHLECTVDQVIEVGNGNVVIGRVEHIHVDPSVWRDGRIDPVLLDPVCRLAGTAYASLGEVFKLPRPSWAADVEGSAPGEAIPRRSRD